ncbi:hypothetical protein QYE76_068116 [Lolium multiflorum]|uniref:TF-B3 domain-containing protein n=1 Tax=Lolium multiflorum TaxID=4521 RepID=A0AAD8WBD9_LOLMU|nr:hypothetical protein QYE76_068116 [Lolium multiflorum]
MATHPASRGWEKFARFHDLQAGCVLTFPYQGDEEMNVNVFDNTSCHQHYHNDDEEETIEHEMHPLSLIFRAAGGPGIRAALVQLGHYLGNVGYLSHDYGSGQGGNNDEDGDGSNEDGPPDLLVIKTEEVQPPRLSEEEAMEMVIARASLMSSSCGKDLPSSCCRSSR